MQNLPIVCLTLHQIYAFVEGFDQVKGLNYALGLKNEIQPCNFINAFSTGKAFMVPCYDIIWGYVLPAVTAVPLNHWIRNHKSQLFIMHQDGRSHLT